MTFYNLIIKIEKPILYIFNMANILSFSSSLNQWSNNYVLGASYGQSSVTGAMEPLECYQLPKWIQMDPHLVEWWENGVQSF